MSPSEIAFLGVGLVLGAAIGAAVVEALRARPAPRRHIRLTISPNSVTPRRSATLAERPAGPTIHDLDEAEGVDAPTTASPAPAAAASPSPPATPDPGWPGRTRVPSGPVEVPATAVPVPIDRPGVTAGHPDGGTPGPGGTPGVLARASVTPGPLRPTGSLGGGSDARASAVAGLAAVAVLDPVAAPVNGADGPAEHALGIAGPLPATLDVGTVASDLVVTARPPAGADRPALSDAMIPVAAPAVRASADMDAGEAMGGATAPGTPATASDRCAPQRTLVDERCSLASSARDHAKVAADALREAQRAYDVLRERLDKAQADADPRALAAIKDELHRRFRRASEASTGAEATEAAARDWLNAINDVNARAREAARFLDTGGEELRAAMPRLDRLGVEADAARISAEAAELGCQEARERLAACEEQAAREAVPAAPADEAHPFDELWPAEHEPTFGTAATAEQPGADVAGQAVILRILRGDRAARDRIVALLAEDDRAATRDWQLRLTALLDAIAARAIEAGYLDLPADDPFWGLFEHRERREIVGALSALGFRFDGLGSFADERIPAARDLSLAVGYAGLDRMRIRAWPQEAELAALYQHASVAADEWLADEADDLALGRMVDALGPRAAELADIWNAWGRLRPALLAAD